MSTRSPDPSSGPGRPRHRATPTPAPVVSANQTSVVVGVIVAISVLIIGAFWMSRSAVAGRTQTDLAQPPGPRAALPSAATAPSTPPPVPAELAAAFTQLSGQIGGRIGIAYAPIDHPQRVSTLGTWSSGPAWSTIKVPLSLALLRQDDARGVTDDMRKAITASDNAAADQIWQALGPHATAATKVRSVLADAGQPVPDVPSEVTRAGFSAFGQTQWSLRDQVRFLAHAACDPRDTPVLDLMGDVIASQRWGLGAIDEARFKGGWGPEPDGSYLVRQYGLITTDRGQLAVAIAAVAESGGFADGTAVLTQMAQWLRDHRSVLDAAHCPSR
jgi:hypothetical protein